MGPTSTGRRESLGDELPRPVVAWRSKQLRAAGYPQYAAFLLSRRLDVDVHDAADLLRRGCPVETALRILL